MAQVLKLKRTSVSGKIPTTSNIELGELAMNTYDGRIFFEKDSGVPVINEILTTNTQNFITGSLKLNGAITGSSLRITGNANIIGNLTLGGNITIGDSTTDSITVTADFSSSLIPDSGSTFDLGSSTKKWNNLHVVSASADYFIGDGSGLTNVVTEVSQVATVTSSFDSQSTINVNHNFDSKNLIVSVYDSNDNQLIPQTVSLTDNNNIQVVLSSVQTGFVVVAKGGHIIASEDLTSYREDVSGNSTYTITHNLNEDYPLVQAWNTSTKIQEIPSIIESLSSSSLQVTFSSTFTGKIVVKK